MKKMFLNLPIMLIAVSALMFSSCKKDNSGTTEDDSISAADVASVTNAVDQTSDDAATVAGMTYSFSGKTESFGQWFTIYHNGWPVCGSTTIDTGGNTITINYDGSTACHGVIRSGSITVTIPGNETWKNAGAILTVNYNVKFTDAVTLGSYTLTGTHTITNETGGLAWEIVAQIPQSVDSVAHKIYSTNMEVTFPNGQTRQWNVDRIRSWSGSGQTITYTVQSDGGNNTETGMNRFGNNFTNAIAVPIAANNQTGCVWKPFQGTFVHTVNGKTTTVVYGTNSSGTPIGSPTICGDGYYITVNNGVSTTRTRFIGYWQ
jgi:hypothetical protein